VIAFVAAAVGLVVLMLAFIGTPLLARDRTASEARRRQNVALYRQRLDELGAEVARGEVAADDFGPLKTELDGTLLDDVAEDEMVASSASRRPLALLAMLTLVLGGAAALLYSRLGALDLVLLDRDRALLAESEAPQSKLDAFADGLAKHLETHPDDAQSWYLLGHARLRQDRYDSAVAAFEQLARITGDDDPVVLGGLAQARYMADKGEISEANRATMMKVLSLAPHDPNVREMLALDAYKHQRYAEAAQHLELALAGGVSGARADALKSALDRARAAAGITGAEPGAAAPSAAQAAAPALAPSAAKAPVHTAAPAIAEGAVPGGTAIRVHVTLAAGVPTDVGRVFVIAREKGGPPMPVAVRVLDPAELPTEVTLSDADAMQPARALSKFEHIDVLARLSKSGSAMRGEGDVESRVVSVERGQSALVELAIGS
jgi:cytochrome c-type biogenesis protein CcmH